MKDIVTPLPGVPRNSLIFASFANPRRKLYLPQFQRQGKPRPETGSCFSCFLLEFSQCSFQWGIQGTFVLPASRLVPLLLLWRLSWISCGPIASGQGAPKYNVLLQKCMWVPNKPRETMVRNRIFIWVEFFAQSVSAPPAFPVVSYFFGCGSW